MKKMILIFILFQFQIFAHKEWVHQYIVNQAYNLLMNSVSNIPPFFDSYFRDANGNFYSLGEPNHPSLSPPIGGAWAEDHYDIVYGHCGFPQIFGCIEASSTHFWNPDGDPYAQNSLEGVTGTFENAFQKAEILWNGNYNIILPGPFSFPDGTTEQQKLEQEGFSWNQVYTYLIIKYYGLSDFIKNRKYYIVGVVTTTQPVYFSTPLEINNSSNNLDLLFAGNILGRLCHLLTDMSVPGHVLIKSHPCDVGNGERYEMEVGGKNWFAISESCNDMPSTFPAQNYTFQNAITQGGILKPWLKNNPLKYLFYTSAQITNVYNCYRAKIDLSTETFLGNRIYNSIDPYTNDNYSEMANIISLIPTSFSNWTQEMGNISNNALVYNIRAVAGLLYWFGVETGLIPSILLKNNFNAGIIKFDNQPYPSGLKFDITIGNNYPLTAIEQSYNNYNYIWNTTAPVAKSFWEKFDKDNYPIQLSNNYNISYNLIANINDSRSTYVAGLRKNYKNTVSHQTEFDGTLSNQQTVYIVEQNSGQISAPSTKTVNGKLYNFAGWTDNLTASNSRTIYPDDNKTYSALYKIVNKSNNDTTFYNNSQRKFLRTPNGTMHHVYESMNSIWYEISTDGGTTWRIMNGGKPVAIDAKLPSMDFYGNTIGIVYQKKNNEYYKIMLRMYYNYGNDYLLGNESTVFDEQVESYNENTNPVIAWGYGGRAYAVWSGFADDGVFGYRNGLVVKTGIVNYSSATWQSQTVIWNTDNNSINPTVAIYKNYESNTKLQLAWEQFNNLYSRKIFYCNVWLDGSNNIVSSTFQDVSSGSGKIWNYRPSIIALANNKVRVNWIGDTDGFDNTFSLFRDPESSRLYNFGYKVRTSQVTLVDDYSAYFIAWSESGTSPAPLNKFTDSYTLSTIRTLNTTGKYLQLCNGTTRNNMNVSSYVANSLPYHFTLSNAIGSYYNIEKDNFFADLSIGRGGILIKDTAQFYFITQDITIENQSVRFKELDEILNFNSVEELNNCLESETFAINDNSEFTITYAAGYVDSLASVASLHGDTFISFVLQLIDAHTGEHLGNLKQVTFNSENIENISESFLVATAGMGNRNVKARVIINTSGEWEYFLIDNFSDESSLGKESYTQINLNSNEMIIDYALAQNYPNPFNPSTTINYQIPEDGFVTIKIYDVIGNEIKTIVNEQKVTGRYNVKFNAGDMASGVYIYKIHVNDFVSSKKMLLLK